MAARRRSSWHCTDCGRVSARWIGRCPGCHAWGTVQEDQPGSRDGSDGAAAQPVEQDSAGPGRAAPGSGGHDRGPLGPLTGLELRDWQADAFAAWAARGCRGVVEAITGAGKTRLAMAAVRVVVARGGVALVLVPTLELQRQWVTELRIHVPSVRVGQLGGGGDDDFSRHDVVVATPNSAADVPITPRHGQLGLLVADEAHRYGAATWALALRDDFAMRLALTATYERSDDGVVDVLGPYFGPVVAEYGYRAATDDRVIAPFGVALVGVDLTTEERAAYERADRAARRARASLVGDHGLPREPRATLRAAVAAVSDAQAGRRASDDQVAATAREWLNQLRLRRDVPARAIGKDRVATALAPHLEGRRTLVFCDTVEQSELVARAISQRGPLAEEIHGGLPDERRRIRMAQFRNGNLSVVVAPRVLDEGVDVPDADVAVVLASFRSRRQMVQRLGRVLRVKGDGGAARLVIAFARDTVEDPAAGAHASFLDEVTAVALVVTTFDVGRPDELATWMRQPLS